VASVAVSIDNRSASRMVGSRNRSGSERHGARRNKPISGTTRTSTANPAGASSAGGTPERSRRLIGSDDCQAAWKPASVNI